MEPGAGDEQLQHRWLNRRRVLRLLIGAALGGAFRPGQTRAGEVTAQEYCYWRTEAGPVCRSDHKVYAYQCYICCSGGTCRSTSCSWYAIGTC